MTGHRRDVRPRYGRIAALSVSLTTSVVAALAGLGVLASSPAPAGAAQSPATHHTATGRTGEVSQGGASHVGSGLSDAATTKQVEVPPAGVDSAQGSSHPDAAAIEAALPAASGSGRRIVFSQGEQRVWLVGAHADDVRRTYLVSGSLDDNLQPGTYTVYSKSRWAVGVDDSGVMQYFVRFTQGPTGAAIGFHTIPTKHGVPQQSKAELGTPQSHGCIRQSLPDAVALWKFSAVGTKVVVVA